MRRPYQVGVKLRELMRKHVESYVRDKTSQRPGNCSFGNSIVIEDLGQTVVLCTAPARSTVVGSLPVCQQTQCSSCPHYCCKVSSREEALSMFKEMISDPVTKRGLYPDVVALEWVLDNSYHEAIQDHPWYLRGLFLAIDSIESVVRRVSKNPTLLSWGKIPGGAPQARVAIGENDEQKGV